MYFLRKDNLLLKATSKQCSCEFCFVFLIREQKELFFFFGAVLVSRTFMFSLPSIDLLFFLLNSQLLLKSKHIKTVHKSEN